MMSRTSMLLCVLCAAALAVFPAVLPARVYADKKTKAKSAKGAKLVKPAKPTKLVKPAKPAELFKPAKPAKPAKPTTLAAPAKPAKPLVVAEKGKVFKWQDAEGIWHYSDRPLEQNALQADLPNIMRAEVKLGLQKVESCTGHGGINCQAGPDGDGSVICADGFTGATTRFRFNCNSPKLTVAEISDLRNDGTYKVTVRNAKSVLAEKPRVSFLKENGKEIPLSGGPAQLEPFGMAEFVLRSDDAGKPSTKPNAVQLKLGCGNCP